MYVGIIILPILVLPRKSKHKTKKKLILTCDACQKTFTIAFTNEKKKRRSHYCSRRCFSIGSKTIVQKHREETCLKLFGSKNAFSSHDKMKRIRSTMMNRYGCENPQQNLKIQEKTRLTCIEKYGIDNPIKLVKSVSKIEEEIINRISLEYNVVRQARINNRKWIIDCYIPSKSLYVEIDGIYWHRLDKTLDDLKNSNDRKGIEKRIRDINVVDWILKNNRRILRIDEITAQKISNKELFDLIENCQTFVSTYDFKG